MKTFKQYINETPMINDIDKEKDLSSYEDDEENKSQRKFISTLKGHKITKTPYNGDTFVKYALHEPDGKISLQTTGRDGADNKFTAENLNGFNNKIPAHEFYHHLITNHDVHLHSDYSQSKGAKKVWERLHKMPGIKMRAYDTNKHTYSDIHPAEGLDQYYDNGNIRLAAKKKE